MAESSKHRYSLENMLKNNNRNTIVGHELFNV